MSAVELETLLERRKVVRRGPELGPDEAASFRTLPNSLSHLGLGPDDYAVDAYERTLQVNSVVFRIGSPSYTGWRLWYDLDDSVITIDPRSPDDADVFAAIVACPGYLADARTIARRLAGRQRLLRGVLLAAAAAVLAAAWFLPPQHVRDSVVSVLSWSNHRWRFAAALFLALGVGTLVAALCLTQHRDAPRDTIRALARRHLLANSPPIQNVIQLDRGQHRQLCAAGGSAGLDQRAAERGERTREAVDVLRWGVAGAPEPERIGLDLTGDPRP